MKISDLSIKRPVLAAVMSLLLIVLGVMSFLRLTLRELPAIDPPIVSVSVDYPGASAAVVETRVTQSLEDALAGIEDRAVAGAAAEVARQVVGELLARGPRAGIQVPLVGRPQRHHEARRAEAALGAVALDQRLLHRVELRHRVLVVPLRVDRLAALALEIFHREQRLAVQRGQELDAGVDRLQLQAADRARRTGGRELTDDDIIGVLSSEAKKRREAAVAFGEGGRYAGRPAYDPVIQSLSGVAGTFHRAIGEPRFVPMVMTDHITGLVAAQAIGFALYRREKTGQGEAIEVPMFETAASFVMSEHLGAATFDPPEGPTGDARLLSPDYRPLPTALRLSAERAFWPHWGSVGTWSRPPSPCSPGSRRARLRWSASGRTASSSALPVSLSCGASPLGAKHLRRLSAGRSG